ncbi:protein of unknown function [Paraburkholderia kururiensis]
MQQEVGRVMCESAQTVRQMLGKEGIGGHDKDPTRQGRGHQHEKGPQKITGGARAELT